MDYRVDQANILKFLRQTVYSPDKHPENLYVIVDTTKDEFEAEWKKIEDKIAKLSTENRRRIYPFVYYSGHGVTLIVQGQQMTFMVHLNFAENIKSLMNSIKKLDDQAQLDMFLEHFVTNL